MITIALITFRESIEVLLVGGAVYSALIEHKIYKQKELMGGALAGLFLSVVLFMLVSYAGTQIKFDMHELGEVIEGVGYMGTGILLFLTAILLHNRMRRIVALSPTQLLTTSIFAIGFLTVLREGMEIVFFSLSSSITASYISSLSGFALGVGAAALVGYISYQFALVKISHTKLLMISEWAIKLLALYFVIKGVMELSEFVF